MNKKVQSIKPKAKPNEGALTKALFDFQTKFAGVEKKRINPFTNSNYASLDDVMNAAKPLLTELQLAVFFVTSIQPLPDGSAVIPVLTCRILHMGSNEVMESSLPLPDIAAGGQVIGSYMTYWRRYLFTGMTNICEAADDDGNATQPIERAATKMTEKQHSEILDFVDVTNTTVGAPETPGTLLFHINATMNLTELEQLSSAQASIILKMLKAKYKRQQEEG